MAKESMKAREVKRKRLVELHAEKRAALKKLVLGGDTDAMKALQKLPRNSSKVRMRNRCKLTGRPRGYMRQFGISRLTFREMVCAAKIPGVTRSSW